MRFFLTLIAVLFIVQSGFVLGQQRPTAKPKLKAPTPVTPAESAKPQNPAVMLTPISGDSKLNLSLIDDVCAHQERRVQVFRLTNAPVQDVADTLNQWLQSKLGKGQAEVDGFICNAPVIIVPELATNSLIVSMASDFSQAQQIEKIIQTLDRKPRTIRVQAVLKKTVNGQTTVIGQPHLILRENEQGAVTFGTSDEKYTIEITARAEQLDKPIKTILHSANQPGSAKRDR